MSDYQHDYNQRQYRLMLSNLKWFENGQRSLHMLVAELETLLNVLEGAVSESWKQSFSHEWCTLESANACAIVYETKPPDLTTDYIRNAVTKLKELVLEQIDDDPADESDS